MFVDPSVRYRMSARAATTIRNKNVAVEAPPPATSAFINQTLDGPKSTDTPGADLRAPEKTPNTLQ